MKVAIFLFFILMSFFPIKSMGKNSHPFPSCLGPVCFDENIWADAQPFFEKYGKGFADEGKFPVYWYLNKKHEYVQIKRYHGENRPIKSIVVSKYSFNNLVFPPSPKIPFPNFELVSGIKIGSPRSKVISTFGKPDILGSAKNKWFINLLPDSNEWSKLDKSTLSTVAYYKDKYFSQQLHFIFEHDKVICIKLYW